MTVKYPGKTERDDTSIFSYLNTKNVDLERLAERTMNDRSLLSQVLSGIQSSEPRIKYGCAKILRIIGEKNPKALYPQWNFFVGMLDNQNTFLKSDGIFILGHLTRVDSEDRIDHVFDKLFGLLDDESMITAANLIGISAIIAEAKPELQSEVTRRLLGIDQTHHGEECKNVLKGHMITSFQLYFESSKDKQRILDFVRKELKNTRPSTRRKAEKFLRKWE